MPEIAVGLSNDDDDDDDDGNNGSVICGFETFLDER
jgi:hypothetical protein